MKTKSFRITICVTFDPQGETDEIIKHRLAQVIRDATDNGTLTGDGPATVESWSSKIERIRNSQ